MAMKEERFSLSLLGTFLRTSFVRSLKGEGAMARFLFTGNIEFNVKTNYYLQEQFIFVLLGIWRSWIFFQ